MRALLATAAAIAPMVVASGAWAETVVTTARTTPIATSSATGTAPDSIRIASNGSITVASGVAATVDSSNTFDMDAGSSIVMDKSADGSTAVLVQGGVATNVILGGNIRVLDNIQTYPDANNDGIPDGPFAQGSNRYGLRITGPGTVTGPILIESAATINVEGDNSSAISIESPLVGNFTSYGAISATGTDATGIDITAPVTGNVDVLGSVAAKGEGAVAVDIQGDVTGRTNVQGTVQSTGYRYTVRPQNKPANGGFNGVVYLENLGPSDLLQGGSAVNIGANLSQGLVFDRAPTYGPNGIEGDDNNNGVKNGDEDDDGDGIKNREDTDRDGDGLLDSAEGTATISAFGSAPAVNIGSVTRDITLGAVGTGDAAYGLVNRGQIYAYGVYDNVNATALRIGGNAGQTTTLVGGMRNEGEIQAVGTGGDATAINLGTGANAATISNTGTIRSTASSATDTVRQSTAIQIDAGATVGSIVNNESIQADGVGKTVNTTAINDLSGTLTSVTNYRNISAYSISGSDAVTAEGRRIAINAANNTAGFTYVQDGVTGGVTTTTPDTDGDGVPDAREPVTVGDILLGSGNDVVDIRNGTVTGAIDFGTGTGSLIISGGANVSGAILSGDGQLSIDVAKGSLDARQTATTNIAALNVGSQSLLTLTLDPLNSTIGGFNVSGHANLADGAGLSIRFDTLLQDAERFTVIDANTLTVGNPNTLLVNANAPYVYILGAEADVAAGKVYVDARRRTASEAGMNASETAAYDALYAGLADNAAIRGAVLGQTSRDGFFDIYEQMMPDHSGGTLMSLASGVDAVTRALTGRNANIGVGETSAWVQEINFYADKDKNETYGFRTEGFGVAGGVERGTNLGNVGISAAFTASDMHDPESAAEEVLSASLLELGLYWRAQGQAWTTWARAAGGYASFESTRRLVYDGLNLKADADWNGYTIAAAAGASYEKHFGKVNVRPEIYGEYFSLHEGARTESGGGDGFDLDFKSRDSHIMSGVAAVNIGYGFGSTGWIRPEVRIGYRHNLSVDGGETIARIASGGDYFTLKGDGLEGGGAILGFRLNVGNDLGLLSITGDAELLKDYVRYNLLLRASFKF